MHPPSPDDSAPTLDVPPAVPPAEGETLPPPAAAENGQAPGVGGPFTLPPGYEFLGELGRGGMGVVCKARQVGLNRLVALKMIRDTALAGSDEVQRFLNEAEAVARLQHQNVVRLFESGRHNGAPYFTLEYIDSGSLATRLDGTPLVPADAARLVEALAHGIDHAHQHGIVHRDLKPGNVLLAPAFGGGVGTIPLPRPQAGANGGGETASPPKAGANWVPKITDFGLAKRVEASDGLTRTGAVMGTPPYMAPEQAGGRKDVGPAADLYALGAILYECLTGRPPFRGPTTLDTLMQVLNDEPVPPTQLQPRTPRDLETICLKCLQKDPARRYASAAALAEDLRRYQAGEPILARPVGTTEKAVKWVRRRPAVAGLLAALAALTALGVSLLLWQYGQTVSERDRFFTQKGIAEEKEKDALFQKGVADQNATDALTAEGKAREAEAKAKETAEKLKDALADTSRLFAGSKVQLAAAALRDPATPVATVHDHLDEVPPDQRFWEWRYLKRQAEGSLFALRGHTRSVNCVAFSADSQRLASAGSDGTVRLWDARGGAAPLVLKGHAGLVYGVAFSPDGGRLASAGFDGTVRLWDARGGAELRVLSAHTGMVLGVAFSPDGWRLASAGWDGTVRLWDALGGAELRVLRGHASGVSGVAFSPDGGRLASTGYDGTVFLWDARGGAAPLALQGHNGPVYGVAFSPDGGRLASAGQDGTVRVWDARGAAEPLVLRGHAGPVLGVAFSPDGGRLASAGQDGTVRVWDARGAAEPLVLRGHTGFVHGVAFSPDGGRLASAGGDGAVRLWDARGSVAPLALRGHAGGVSGVAFSPDGGRLASTGQDGTVRLWDTRGGAEPLVLRGHARVAFSVAFSPDGGRLASAGQDGAVRLWDARGGAAPRFLRGYAGVAFSVAFSPDGGRLASAGWDGTVRLWDARGGAAPLALRGHTGAVYGVAFSLDGERLASAGQDGTVRVWDARGAAEPLVLRGHTGEVRGVAFSPDGGRLASAGWDGTVRLWDARGGAAPLALRGQIGQGSIVSFSPDGHRIFATNDQGMMARSVVGASTVGLMGSPPGLGPFLAASALIPERAGKILAWDAKTGQPLPGGREPFDLSRGPVSPDGKRFAVLDAEGSIIRVFDLDPPDEWELGYREWVTRFDPFWHRAEADREEKSGEWFAAAFHLGQLAGQRGAGRTDLLRRLARAQAQHGHWDRTVADYDRLLALSPADAPLYLGRGRAHVGQGDWPAALADYARFLWLAPDLDQWACDGPPYQALAEVLVAQQEWDGAAAVYVRGLRNCPFEEQAKLYLLLSRHSELRPRVARLRTEDVVLWVQTADRLAAGRQEDLPASLEWYTRVLEQRPEEAASRRGRGTSWARLGQWEQAATDFARLIELQVKQAPGLGKQPFIEENDWHGLLLCQLGAGQTEAARQTCIRLLDQGPDEPDPNWDNNRAYWTTLAPGLLADPCRAVVLAERVVKDIRSSAYLNTLGAALVRADRAEEAVKVLNESITQQGGNGSPEDWLFLALAQLQLKQPDEARKSLDKAAPLMKDTRYWRLELERRLLRSEVEAGLRR
jgi:WD40 repeat protein/serine/threonine protein kinase/tetratricopeptide (TPR) repeat protein